MKKNLLIITWSILMQHNLAAQTKNGIENYNFLSTKEAYVWMPVIHHVSKKGFYTELRYNYEALKTASLYLGKSFTSGSKTKYTITPMMGLVMGDYNGGSLAANIDIEKEKIFASMQTQYTVNKDDRNGNFFFNWTELAYQPVKWMYAGLSTQQTKNYNCRLQSDYGVLIGFLVNKFTIPVYVFNPLSSNRNFIIGVNTTW
ncbi:hypothetical protein [Ferruginibacter sp.]